MHRDPLTPITRPRSAPRGPVSGAWSGAAAFTAFIVFLSVGYFQNSRPGWNVNSQFALTCAIVEHRTLSIDAYHELPGMETGDKAFFEGHFYSDKSPVTAFLGVPAFAAYRAFCRFAEIEIDYAAARYWTTWWTIGMAAAALTLLTAALLRRADVPVFAAAAFAGLWVMATPLLGFSILFYNYTPAAALALGGFLLVQPALGWNSGEARGESPRWPAAGTLFAAGLLIGLACWTLQTYALLALLLTAGLAWSALRTGAESASSRRQRFAGCGAWALGGLAGVAGYAVYSFAIFGELTSPYRYEFNENFREQMAQGLMGAGIPDPRVIGLLTLHPFRGLFFLFPITAAALLGALDLLRRKSQRGTACAALLFFTGLLLYNAGYYMWWGGWSYAPRHLIPALTLLSVGLAPWIAASTGRLRGASMALLLLIASAGATTNTAVVSLDPQPPPGVEEAQLYAPETVGTWPSPYLDLLRYVVRGQTDANWGTGVGLGGVAGLVPLGLLWLFALALLFGVREAPWGTITGLTALMAVGAALRLAHLDSVPPGLWFDEALNLQDATTAAVTGHFRMVYTEVFPREPMFLTLLTLLMKAGATTVAQLRGLSVAIGLITLLALYGCLRTAGERGVALAAAASLAVLRWHAVMSRVMLRTLLLPLWITLIVWAAFAMRRRPSWSRAVILGALVGGGFYTYLAWYFMLPGVGLLCLWAVWPALRSRALRGRALAAVAAALLTAAPILYDYATHPDHIISRPKAVSLTGEGRGWRDVAAEIGKNAMDAAGMFHRRGDHVPTVNIPEAPALDPVMGVVFVAGLAALLWGAARGRPLEIVVLGWLLLGISPTILTKTDSPNFLRTLVATPAVATILALGLVRPGEWLLERSPGRLARVGWTSLVVAVLLVSSLWTTRDVFFRWARDERVWQGFNGAEAQVGRAALDTPAGTSIWIPGHIRDHRTVRFLTRDLKSVHSYRSFAFLRPSGGDSGPRRIVVTFHNQLYPVLEALVPEGKIVNVFDVPGGKSWALVYEIPEGGLPPADLVDRAETAHPVKDVGW